ETEVRILTKEDQEAGEIVARALRSDGVELLTSSEITRIEMENGETVIHFERNGTAERRTVDRVLIGVGRKPNVEGLNLEAVGVEYDSRRGVIVNDQLQTTNRTISAAGDVCSQDKFTHLADFQARIVVRNALFPLSRKASSLTVPWCTYTSPEIAHVGMDEHEARQRGIDVQTFVQKLSEVDRAVIDEAAEGFVKVHVKKGSDKILGATIVAEHAGDMISEISTAMAAGMGLKRIAEVIHPYPTQAEAIRKLGDQYNRTRLTGPVQWLLRKWLAWR
ncbi:MAG: FAD-dependent oxidoreductase, partial [Planctomycetaceae bacterium]